jgi:EAL domain-containing protein (putative c-di-GMP-specific phosphodiesterase class I)
MSSSLGFSTIAEGVETAEQLAILKQKGCDQIQGYHFSRPLAPEELEAFIADFDSGI